MKKNKILILFFLCVNLYSYNQINTKYEIIQDNKGKYSLIDKLNKTIVNKYKGCDYIGFISNLKYPTNPKYKDYLLIQKKNIFILYNIPKEEEISEIKLDSKFSISIDEIFLTMSIKDLYLAPKTTNPNQNIILSNDLIRDYSIIKLHIKKAQTTVTLLLNLISDQVITKIKIKNNRGTSFSLLDEDLIFVYNDPFNVTVINDKGRKIVPLTAENFYNHFNGGFAYKDYLNYGAVNYRGDTIAQFIYSKVKVYPKYDFAFFETPIKVGVINAQGKTIIPFNYRPEYNSDYSFSDFGVFKFYKEGAKERSSFVFVDTTGVELIKENTYQDAWELWIPDESDYIKRYYFVKNDKIGIYDTKQKKEIIPCKYTFYKERKETKLGVISAEDEKEKWGLLSLEDGSVIIPFEYESGKSEFIYVKDSIAIYILSKGDKYGVINYKGEVQLPIEYSDIVKTNYESLLILEKDGFYGLFDLKTTRFVVPVEMIALDEGLNLRKLENEKIVKGKFDINENKLIWEE